MAGIALDAGRCVRALSKFSECRHCAEICPTDALQITGMLPSINLSECVGCGGCVGVCPTEALKLDDFDSTEFFFQFASESANLISCRKNVPCISVLNVEHIISLTALKGALVFDMGHCADCEIASSCQPQIEANAEEASYLLEAMENEAKVTLASIAYKSDEKEVNETDRRDFFRNLTVKNAMKTKLDFDREVETATDERLEHTLDSADIAKMRKKQLTDKRKLFFTALKRVEKPSVYHVIDATEVTFTSQKLLDVDNCTACQMCYRICPTGALSSDPKNSKIDFDPFLCIKCQLCHDVCEPKCLTLSPSYNLKEMFEPEVQNLATFKVKNCNECARPFVSLHGEKLCYQCKIEEEEARELWGIDSGY
ncbi:MAG: 4Fe-4S binding protein [Campylobacterota bacterium]|nr:4Fe-4S binding protein [Campylobacterota bacterium]